jgi:hypothetical protein
MARPIPPAEATSALEHSEPKRLIFAMIGDRTVVLGAIRSYKDLASMGVHVMADQVPREADRREGDRRKSDRRQEERPQGDRRKSDRREGEDRRVAK